MTIQHFKFPSIEQFRNVVKLVNDRCKWNEISVKPKISFCGTVKLHGSNGAICIDHETGDMWCQSRERILSLTADNAGFCQWFEINKTALKTYLKFYKNDEYRYTVIYGEWCGGSIQKGVALNQIDKMFVIFKIFHSNVDESKWIYPNKRIDFHMINVLRNHVSNIYLISEFPTYECNVDFNNPELSQNEFVRLTELVEQECPVGKSFNVSGIGEGIIWTAFDSDIEFNLSGLMFKVKGEKHQSSKVKTLSTVDVEVISQYNELVDYLATENRMKQGIEVLKSNGVDTDCPKNTKQFIIWIKDDIIKEETDTILASGLEFGKVISKIMSKAGQFYNTR